MSLTGLQLITTANLDKKFDIIKKMNKLTQKKVREIMKIEGEARGVTLKSDWSYIKNKFGDEGVEKLEKRMKGLGRPLKFEEIKDTKFYPLGLDLISILVIKEIFDFNDKDLEKMGEGEVKFSIFAKLFFKHLVSLKKIAEECSKMFSKHYTRGEIKVKELSKEECYAKIRLVDFNVHPVYCSALKGYFKGMLNLALGKDVTVKETKCSHKGDPFHEFVINWE